MTRLSRYSKHDDVFIVPEILVRLEVDPLVMNLRDGFDDDKRIWKCTECEHKNSIWMDNIFESQEYFFGGDDPIK